MKVLVFGASGQLGKHLLRSKPNDVELLIPSRFELDFYDGSKICDYVLQHEPTWVINAAAYTNVDQAETDKNAALTINHGGPTCLAWACGFTGSKLLHISTDYVFDGTASTPYETDASPNPLNYYGHTKLQGERAIQDIMQSTAYCILRTSWIYSEFRKNFFKTIFDSLVRGKDLSIINDQIGRPTSAAALALVCWRLVEANANGLFHYGEAPAMSWYDFAVNIRNVMQKSKLYTTLGTVEPTTTEDYGSLILRPAFSVLSNIKLSNVIEFPADSWEQNLSSTFYNYILPIT
jgi:dTDP-4-dehydrorhamnose reductase